MTDMSETKKQDKPLFFEDPNTAPKPPGEFSVLYLLRRDIKACLDNKTPWSAAMMIVAGIDLLAKFNAGEDSVGNIGKRFRGYINEHFEPLDEGELIYQLRNSLFQSFGLRSKDKKGNVYKFSISASPGQPLFHKHDGRYVVEVHALSKAFEESIDNYRKTLTGPIPLERFLSMVPDYGFIYVA
jgi:hypothetical protein